MRVTVLLLFTVALVIQGPATVAVRAQEGQAPATTRLDFEFFKTKVQPIFLAKREGHARCVACHTKGTPMRLQALSPGATTWDDEQSRKNFQVVVPRVLFRNLTQSRLLLHPLEAEAGGDFYHSGGKHWNSFFNPEWQIMANWVCGRKANEKIVELTGECGLEQ
jgi:hypothetical protein